MAYIAKSRTVTIVAAFLASAMFAGKAAADAVADFYKGKTVTVVVAAGPGGGHTKYTQFIAPFLQKHLPGNPKFIVQNMGGAGGTKAANFLYTRGLKNGTMIGILLSDTPLASRLRTTGVKYVANEFQFLGGADQPRSAFVVFKNAGVKTLDDAKQKQVILGSTGKGSQTYILPTLVNSMLGTKFKVITGYRGMGGIYIAMDKGEVKGFQSSWPAVAILRPHWIEKNEITVPKEIQDALSIGNQLQDILTDEFVTGRTGNEILFSALKKAKAAGIKPQIYTHPIGYYGHGSGPTIGMWDKQDGCLLYTSPSPRDGLLSRMPSSA